MSDLFSWTRSSSISFKLLVSIGCMLKATPLSLFPDLLDTLSWNGTPSSSFSLSYAYNIACNIVNEPLPIGISNWNWFWKLQLLPKLKFFIWELFHCILSSTTFLNKRGWTLSMLVLFVQAQHAAPKLKVEKSSKYYFSVFKKSKIFF